MCTNCKKPYYISTAIAYTSGKPHIGNTYEIVLADAIARYKSCLLYTSKDAPSGVMETIIYEAFQVFKEEGIGYGSLGGAPLSGLSAESKNPMERLLYFSFAR